MSETKSKARRRRYIIKKHSIEAEETLEILKNEYKIRGLIIVY